MSKELNFNKQISKIGVSDIRQFDAEVSLVPDMVKLTLGEPDFATPEHIKQAAIAAINADQSHYTPNAGIPELRAAAANYYNEKFNLNYQPSQVITTVGATEGIAASLQAILNEDETVLMPTPMFPIYIPDTYINNGQMIGMDTSEDDFVLTAQRLRSYLEQYQDKKIKALVLNYPSNPTGVTYSRKQLAELAEVIKEYDLWVLSDEIYAELTYNQKHVSLGELIPDHTILITGLSKSHAMTGWRIGYIMGPQVFIDQVIKSHQYMVTAPTTNAQYAALEAMLHGQNDADEMKVEYQKRRDYMTKELTDLGFEVASPDGAFYIFAKIPANLPTDSWEFVRDLAKKAKLALIPGASFGKGGDGYVRLSYAASMETLQEAIARIQAYMELKATE